MKRRTLIIIPTYNEAGNITALLEALQTFASECEVLVVDDNSPDGTQSHVEAKMAKYPTIHLLRRAAKQGLGAAYKAGFQWGLQNGFDQFLQMDADFSHPPSAIPSLLEGLHRSPVVLGSRYISQGSISGWGIVRKVVSRGGNLYARSVLQIDAHDLTGGFNGWRREVLENIDYASVSSKGYVFQIELKYRAIKKGYTLLEIPIHFENRTQGKSKMSGSIFWEAAFQVLKLRKSGLFTLP